MQIIRLLIGLMITIYFYWFLFTLVLTPVKMAIENASIECLFDRTPITCIEIKKMSRSNNDK